MFFQHTEYRGRHHLSFITSVVTEKCKKKPCLVHESYEDRMKTEAFLSHVPESQSLDVILSEVFL